MKNLLNIFRDTSPGASRPVNHIVMDMLRPRLDLSTHQEDLLLRFACEEDLSDILQLESRAYLGYEAWKMKDFKRDWQGNPHGVYIILEDVNDTNPIMVAAIIGRFRSRGSHISHVIVEPDFQGRGFGKLLMNKWIECAQILRTPKISLEVRQSNYRAQQLYQGFGFEKRNIKPFYYTNNNEDALEMVYDLRRC